LTAGLGEGGVLTVVGPCQLGGVGCRRRPGRGGGGRVIRDAVGECRTQDGRPVASLECTGERTLSTVGHPGDSVEFSAAAR
jgi:hypothetical protein